MSKLDEALLQVRQDALKENDFYNVFLNSNVFIPTHDNHLLAPSAFSKFAGFLRAAQQAIGTDVAIEFRPIDRRMANFKSLAHA
ncbi:MAG: hypothetical protein M3Y82_05005 [Verrucomicrobiota bacterium]|nr:hypothetical protein [Verrucomicrobiota bacterium]